MPKKHIPIPRYVRDTIERALEQFDESFPDGYQLRSLSTQEHRSGSRTEWSLVIDVAARARDGG